MFSLAVSEVGPLGESHRLGFVTLRKRNEGVATRVRQLVRQPSGSS